VRRASDPRTARELLRRILPRPRDPGRSGHCHTTRPRGHSAGHPVRRAAEEPERDPSPPEGLSRHDPRGARDRQGPSRPNHPPTSARVGRMNRVIEGATL